MAKIKTKLQLKVEGLLKEKRLTKKALADALQIPKQNVDRIFTIQKMPQMKVVADFLGISLEELLNIENKEQASTKHQIDGFVEFDGSIFRIRTEKDILNLAEKVKLI